MTHLAALVLGAALPPLLGLNLVHAALVRRFAAPHHGVGLHGCGIRESMITSIMEVNNHLYNGSVHLDKVLVWSKRKHECFSAVSLHKKK